uniref:Gamma-butyrolactone receptor protein n=1 Tax=Streptomyces fradiae TaxID=1906 RepID=UPI000B8BB350|nr:Chain A, Gamma-butyrolactone receptor protein [Streptomyces fradiae]5XAZ_B Chain B, Gamma-butyrolactone receptor protein [Streptomyces fradiae]5XAZ_C Chain C, Gamma-butyrolactone receptor protein [Streptomyces fradiae]5XAZ_D Chain D, Gamma-butyrolactone receptor protein [Streptomyces fradiae]5XAZ_E Chain E, Gamma-butyrolactone receptor protein [Streptomyces fradiae]5XAZ_F Chain F, Gamma-butyrolactone receptor protein [Streptomyces fradiae]5XAZ_G Chain G, Gamma-butyrolactone receptor protei
ARQERAAQTRRTIVAAAAAVFDELGYEATTIAEILKRSGVTKGALYFHFTSKEQLAQEVLTSQLRAVPPVEEQRLVLQQIIDETLLLAQLLSKGDPLVRGSVRLTVEPGAPADGLDRRAPMQEWIGHGRDLLRRAEAGGELLPRLDVDAVARMLVGGFTGAQILSNILTGHADLLERVTDMHRHLMTSVAVPAVLVRLDFSAERSITVYDEAMRRREAPLPAAGDLEH